MAYAQLEPFGSEIEDLRFGILLALLANIHRDPKRHPKPFEPRDFMLSHCDTDKDQTAQQQVSIAEIITAVLGGKDLRKKQ